MFIDLFPTTLFKKSLKEISSQELNSYIEFVLNTSKAEPEENPHGFSTLNQNLLTVNIFSKLKEYILINSRIYIESLGYKGFDIQISTSWGNVLSKNQNIPSHYHSNSFISGVFYPQDSSPLTFESPTKKEWIFKTEKELDTQNFRTWEDYHFYPKTRDLLLFPSFVYHGVTHNMIDDRVSIAFNIIPKGEFGGFTSKIYF